MKKRKVCLLVKRKENEKCEHRERRKGIGHPSDDDESERRELLRKTQSSFIYKHFRE